MTRTHPVAVPLASKVIVADASGAGKVAYGNQASTIVPYIGDSTLLADFSGRSFLVLDGGGSVARVMSAPRPNDMSWLGNGGFGAPGFDLAGRMLYRVMLFPAFKPPVVGKPYAPPVAMPDSAPILRVDLDTRKADTVAWVRTAKIKIKTVMLPNGGVRLTAMITPISTELPGTRGTIA